MFGRNQNTVLAAALCLLGTVAQGTSQDCVPASDLGPKCAPFVGRLAANTCIRPGLVFLSDGKWSPVTTAKQSNTGKRTLDFFYVVDSRGAQARSGLVFVGIEQVMNQSGARDIKLSKNEDLNFEESEQKTEYGRSLQAGVSPTRPMRRWGKLDSGSIFDRLPAKRLDALQFPQAADNISRAPHARLYSYKTGSISCIPFIAKVTGQVRTVYGKALDLFSAESDVTEFEIRIE